MGISTTPTEVSPDTLAQMVRDASDEEYWNAFGKTIQEKAQAGTHDYVAMPIEFPTCGTPTLDQIQPGYSMSADTWDYLDELYSKHFDAHIIVRATASGAIIDVTRERVALALENVE